MEWIEVEARMPVIGQRIMIATTISERPHVCEGYYGATRTAQGFFTIMGAGPMPVTHWSPIPTHPAFLGMPFHANISTAVIREG
jgi:hypothetical protein